MSEAATAESFGDYEVVRRLARGGMAELYLARARRLQGFEKLVVIKRILPAYASDPEFVRMFFAEARLAATLEHPNAVTVFDVGIEDDQPFFAMEYIPGPDLRRLMRAASEVPEGLPLRVAIHIAAQVCAGLHHAHERVVDGQPLGMVHRDVSPTNVLVGPDGNVKVVDFGIAKAASVTGVTEGGVRRGKVAYMSPEQCRCEPIDRRSDIFSIGVLLYELTTLQRCFTGDNEFALMNRIVSRDALAPSLIASDYPPALEAIVMRALQREPDQRYPTAKALRRELLAFARAEGHLATAADVADYVTAVVPLEEPDDPGGSTAALAPTLVDEPPTRVMVRASEPPSTAPEPQPERGKLQRDVARRWLLGAVGVVGVLALAAYLMPSRPGPRLPLATSPSAAGPGAPVSQGAPTADAVRREQVVAPLLSETARAESTATVEPPVAAESPTTAPAAKRPASAPRPTPRSDPPAATPPAKPEDPDALIPF